MCIRDSWKATYTLFSTVGGAAQILGMMVLYPLLRKKLSSTQVFQLSLVLALCGYGTLLVFCLTGLSHSLALLCIPGVVVFACNGMLSVLTTLFLSNSVDYGQLKTGRREESVIFSMQTFVVKAASGVAVFLTGIGLDLIGLVGNTEETGPVAVQSAGTLLGLRLMMTVLPMLCLLYTSGNAQLVGGLFGEIPQFQTVRLGHVRETRAEALIVGADERVRAHHRCV